MSHIGRGIIAKYLPKNVAKWIDGLQFRPGKPSDMEPSPLATQKLAGVDRIQGYRSPAPGSRPAPRVPRLENSDEVFDTKYYHRDTRRMPRNHIIYYNKKYLNDDQVKAITDGANEPNLDWGSSGKFGNPAVKTYDDSGLRSVRLVFSFSPLSS